MVHRSRRTATAANHGGTDGTDVPGLNLDRGFLPNLHATDRGTYVVQGYRVDDPEALATLRARGLPAGETVVEIPAAPLNFVPNGGA